MLMSHLDVGAEDVDDLPRDPTDVCALSELPAEDEAAAAPRLPCDEDAWLGCCGGGSTSVDIFKINNK